MRLNLKSRNNEPDAAPSGAIPRTAWRTSAPCLMLTFLIAFGSSAKGQTPQSAPLTPEEQRKVLASLVECEGLASEFQILAMEAQLLREARDAQARAAVLFETAATEERKARLAQEALTEQAREETKAERKKGRWNLFKGVGVGICIGIVVGVAVGVSGGD